MVIDAQVHVWRDVLPGIEPHLSEPFTASHLLELMDQTLVDRAVLVPIYYDSGGNGTALDAARRHPHRYGVMANLTQDAPLTAKELRDWWESDPGLLGARMGFRREPHSTWLVDGTVEWFWRAAAEIGLPIMAYAPKGIASLAAAARRYPDLRLVVDHMGMAPDVQPAVQREQMRHVLAMAELPNVAVKISALPLYSRQPYPHVDLLGTVQGLLAAYGADRVFWGTDFTRLQCTYPESVSMMDSLLAGVGARERALVMGEGLSAWLPWPDPGQP
jgi:L-fuconolactonase